MLQSLTFLLGAIAATSISAFPQVEGAPRCPPFSGNFTIDQYQLYSENLDFDFQNCLLYLGCLWNASVGIYDPYTSKMVEILEFPGITHNPDFHIGGVGVDERTGLLSIVVDAGDAFNSAGQNISGSNYIMQWDPTTRELLYKTNLTETTQGKYGGFQDLDQDPDGNVYVVGTYPSSILRVSQDGKTVTPWYVPASPINTTISGLSGLATKDWILLGDDSNSGQIWRFDMRAEKGVPVPVPVTPNHTFGACDAIYFPPKYEGTVLLVSEDLVGVSVFRSKDGEWKSAEYLGIVPWTDPTLFVTAVMQIGESIYMNIIPFQDSPVPGTAGNQSHFLFPDITKQIEALVSA